MGSISIQCPACLSKATTKSHTEVSPVLRELESACSNLRCGHTFVSQTEFSRTVKPSELPVDVQTKMLLSHVPTEHRKSQLEIFGDIEPETLPKQSLDRSGFKIKCSRCLSDATIYASFGISPLLREHWCVCENDVCCHSFVSHTSFSHSLSPTMLKFAAAPHPELLSIKTTVVALPVPVVSVRDAENDGALGDKMNWIDPAA